jgi:hypothetical protein
MIVGVIYTFASCTLAKLITAKLIAAKLITAQAVVTGGLVFAYATLTHPIASSLSAMLAAAVS